MKKTTFISTLLLLFFFGFAKPNFAAEEESFGPFPRTWTFSGLSGIYLHGKDQRFFNSSDRIRNIWDYGLRLGYAFTPEFEIESNLEFIPTLNNLTTLNTYHYSLNGVFQRQLTRRLTPYAVFGLGGATYDQNLINTDHDLALNYGVGLKFFIARKLALRPELRLLSSFGNGHTAFLGTLGLTYYMAGKKRIKMSDDSDADGIPDALDRCPNEVETFNQYEDQDGCPDQLPQAFKDTDQDGIEDTKDLCPTTPENFNGIDDTDGCPELTNPQTGLDQDKDGLLDLSDKCPVQPETVNNYMDDDGCPDVVPEALKQFTGKVEGIYFDTGKDTIKPTSHQTLNLAVEVLKNYKDLYVLIEGHTDSTGSKKLNLELSERRALSVRQYLISNGIEHTRVATQGYGPDKPVGSNKTPTGRAKNRRIEFKLLTRPK